MSIRSTVSGAILMALIQAWGLSAAQAEGPLSPPRPRPDFEAGQAHRGCPEAALPPGFHTLALSEAQQDKIFAILHAQAPARRNLDRDAQRAREALREQARAEVFDAKRARDLADALGKAVAEEALLRARSEQQVLAVLTTEQRQRLAQAPGPGEAESAGRAGDPPPSDRRAPPQRQHP